MRLTKGLRERRHPSATGESGLETRIPQVGILM